jgi:hypothetical protein
MRSILLSVSFLVSTFTFAQQKKTAIALPLTDNKIVYHDSTATNLYPQEQVYKRALKWYKTHLQSSDNRLIVDKPETGKMSGTGVLHFANHEKTVVPADVFFTIDIIARTGSYEYRVYDIYSFERSEKFYYSDMYNEELYPMPKPKWDNGYREAMLNNMNTKITGMLRILQNYMNR